MARAFPEREGPRPLTTATNPHSQLDQQPAEYRLRDVLEARIFALPNVERRPSGISVPGAHALWLSYEHAEGPPEAFMVGTEFAHVHPPPDLSLHLMLPEHVAPKVISAGWGELHPMALLGMIPGTALMIYAPRSDYEVDVVLRIVEMSHSFASGHPLSDPSAAVSDL